MAHNIYNLIDTRLQERFGQFISKGQFDFDVSDIDEMKKTYKPVFRSHFDDTHSAQTVSYDVRLRDLMSGHVSRSMDYKKIKRKVVDEGEGPETWHESEYDLEEVTTLLDVECYVRRGFKKRLSHMFKDGVQVDGDNERNVKYVKRRLREIAFFTGISTLKLWREMAFYYLVYSNVVLVKRRARGVGTGVPRRSLSGRRVFPVVGYFPVSPAFVEYKTDKWRNIVKYRIWSTDKGKYQDFDPEDIIHITRDKKYEDLTGTPDLVSAAADIATLRQIEENIELYFYQHLFPLYHYQVGDENQDAAVYPDGTREIDIVREQIQYMPTEGCIVTPLRHQINQITESGKFSQVVDVHDVFKRRVFASLGMSDIDFGEGNVTTKASATTLSNQLIDDVKDDEASLADVIETEIFTEMLLEAPFAYNPFNEEDLVHMVFPDPDKETMLRMMDEGGKLVDLNVLTIPELRKMLGLKPMTAKEWSKTAWVKYQRPSLKIQYQSTQETYTEQLSHDATSKPAPAGGATPAKKPASGSKPSGGTKPKPAAAPKPKPKVTKTKKTVVKNTVDKNVLLSLAQDVLYKVMKGEDESALMSSFSRYAGPELADKVKGFVAITKDLLADGLTTEFAASRQQLLDYLLKQEVEKVNG